MKLRLERLKNAHERHKKPQRHTPPQCTSQEEAGKFEEYGVELCFLNFRREKVCVPHAVVLPHPWLSYFTRGGVLLA